MTEQVAHIGWLGWIVFAIVVGSVFFVILAAIFGKPRKPKVTLVFIGTLCALTATVIVGIWIGGHIFSVLM
ncbi:MAG: hypothetical protein ACE5PV_07325 [Candidatus Poribacteria bacterium]